MGSSSKITRRKALAVGVGMTLASKTLAQPRAAKADDLNVAVIGCGWQARNLVNDLVRVHGVRFVALCDIWTYSARRMSRTLKAYGHEVATYENCRKLLAAQHDLDAVIIATPDWMHAEHTIACLEAGLHVYCESPIAHSLEDAGAMVRKARNSGKLLQIGYQRRSNPRYRHAIDVLHHREAVLGPVNQARTHWHRPLHAHLGWPKKYAIDDRTLAAFGYEDMDHFRNWQWYADYSAGPLLSLCSHQLDACNWTFGTNPDAVTAVGGMDHPQKLGHDNYDNVTSIFEYETQNGPARAIVQLLHTSRLGYFREVLLGHHGALKISELPELGSAMTRSPDAGRVQWQKLMDAGLLEAEQSPRPSDPTTIVNVCVGGPPPGPLPCWPLPAKLSGPPYQPHMENFLDAIRTGAPLRCPAETAYATAVAMLRARDAVAAEKKLRFSPEDFLV